MIKFGSRAQSFKLSEAQTSSIGPFLKFMNIPTVGYVIGGTHGFSRRQNKWDESNARKSAGNTTCLAVEVVLIKYVKVSEELQWLWDTFQFGKHAADQGKLTNTRCYVDTEIN